MLNKEFWEGFGIFLLLLFFYQSAPKDKIHKYIPPFKIYMQRNENLSVSPIL